MRTRPVLRIAMGSISLGALAALTACQLLLPSDGGSSGAGGASSNSSAATGYSSCDESKVFKSASATCPGDAQCGGFCDAAQSACGPAIQNLSSGCCSACKSIGTLKAGFPFCCREPLLKAAASNPNAATCAAVLFGDGSAKPCGGTEKANFCALAVAACTTADTCVKAKDEVVPQCQDKLVLALALGVTRCNALATCIANQM